ncbi:MAG: cation-translocating P-type ATPase [Verrucomicrobia bacterium]|nr:cation-translocating P-type ATPase [Verrucomicrobiota bacterium]
MQYAGRISDRLEEHHHGHGHGHDHGHSSLEIEQTRTMTGLVAVLAGAALVLNGIIIDWFIDKDLGVGSLSALVGAVLLAAPIFRNAVRDLIRGHVHMSELAAAAVGACFAIGDYKTAGVVAFLMLASELVEHRTALGALRAIESLVRLTPTLAHVIGANGREEEREAHKLTPGERFRVRPGDSIPADGVVRGGEATVNQATITGESLPVEKQTGDQVFAGTINESGTLEVEVTRAGRDTTLGRVRHMILQAEVSKLPIMRLIDRYASYYTPFMLMLAVIVYFFTREPRLSIGLLVLACPCALVLANPTAMVAALSSAARLGILVKNVSTFETAADLNAFVFDKTGTLTTGSLSVVRLTPAPGVDVETMLTAAAGVEQYSKHPAARAVIAVAREAELPLEAASEFREVAGKGVSGKLNGTTVLVGRESFMRESKIDMTTLEAPALKEAEGFSTLYVARGGKLMGWIGLEDRTRPEAKQAARELGELGIKRLVMVTGDRPAIAEKVAGQMGCSEYEAECLPERKLNLVEEMKAAGYKVAVVGDGVNDAPALAAGDIGIAMGAAGSDVALESAPVVLMNNDLARLPFFLRLARRVRRIIYQNLGLSLLFVIGGMILVVSLRLVPVEAIPIIAALVHVTSPFAVIFNSARLVRFGEEMTPHTELVAARRVAATSAPGSTAA